MLPSHVVELTPKDHMKRRLKRGLDIFTPFRRFYYPYLKILLILFQETTMTTRRTPEQWQKLLANRNAFSGTNIEFCELHNISITSFYKHQATYREQSATSFVQVTTITEQVQVETHNNMQFDVSAGKLTLPLSMHAAQIVAIIRGLSS